MRRRTYVVRAGLCAASLLICAASGRAQSAEIPPVPDSLDADLKQTLDSVREILVTEEARLRSIAAEHNERCRQVAAESPTAASCTARRDSLRTAAAALRQNREKYRNAVEEIRRIADDESTLLQAMRAGVERMRTMIDDATRASQEQLSALSEELRRQLDGRKEFRRRRETAVAGVRG